MAPARPNGNQMERNGLCGSVLGSAGQLESAVIRRLVVNQHVVLVVSQFEVGDVCVGQGKLFGDGGHRNAPGIEIEATSVIVRHARLVVRKEIHPTGLYADRVEAEAEAAKVGRKRGIRFLVEV